jgi:hypothetical protein
MCFGKSQKLAWNGAAVGVGVDRAKLGGNVDFIGYEKGPGVAGCEDNELRPQVVLWIRCSTSHQIGMSSGMKSKGTAIVSRDGVTSGTNTSASNFPQYTKIKRGWMESLCHSHGGTA